MKKTGLFVVFALSALAAPAFASGQTSLAGTATRSAVTLPASTLVVVTPLGEITSKRMHEGDVVTLSVVNDVVHDGVVVIPRGSPVKATVIWRTGKGIGGKSAKFELTFNSVNVAGRDWALRGTHRQEGRGNTVAALLGSFVISGRSAVMTPGQLINVFTAEQIATGS